MRKLLLPLVLGLFFGAAAPAAEGDIPEWAKGSKVFDLFNDEKHSDQFLASDPAVWKSGKGKDGKGYIELAYDRKSYKSSYSPKYRSPVHILLQKTMTLKDFVFDVEMMSTTEAYGHQDLCLFFGFQSPEKYYYVHIARAADMNAHNVFIVNEAARKNIAKETTKGVEWKKDVWHKVRLVRRASTGKIEVYFDDMTKPIMKAEDKTFTTGYVGVGSFDDTGRFRNGAIYYQELTIDGDKKPDFFKPLGKDK